MDALELAEQEEKNIRADEKAAAKAKRKGELAPPARRPNPVLLNLPPLRYVLRTLQVNAGDGRRCSEEMGHAEGERGSDDVCFA